MKLKLREKGTAEETLRLPTFLGILEFVVGGRDLGGSINISALKEGTSTSLNSKSSLFRFLLLAFSRRPIEESEPVPGSSWSCSDLIRGSTGAEVREVRWLGEGQNFLK